MIPRLLHFPYTKLIVDGTIAVTVVAVLELSSGIIAACIPACMPFIAFRKRKERSWYALSKPSTAQGVDDHNSMGKSNLRSDGED